MARPALAATRAIAVLNYLAAHTGEEFTLSELSASLDVNISSMHALLKVLTDSGYVVRHSRLRTFALGPSVVALGTAALERHPAIDLAREEARHLAEELDLTVAVTALAGNDILFLSRVGEHRVHDLGVQVGQRIPLVAPVGSAFVAWQDAESWLAKAHDRPAMEQLLSEVRAQGWSVAVRHDPGAVATGRVDTSEDSPGYDVIPTAQPGRNYDPTMIAAPVFDRAGRSIVALTLLGFEPGIPGEQICALGERVRDACLVVTRRSGGRPPVLS